MQTHSEFTGVSHDPAQIQQMTAAYDLVLSLLGLQYRDDSITRLVAAKIIEVFGRGVADPQDVCSQVLTELGIPQPPSL